MHSGRGWTTVTLSGRPGYQGRTCYLLYERGFGVLPTRYTLSRRLLVLTAIFAVVAAVFAAPASADKNDNNGQGAENSPEVNLQILAINDFHGNIATS